MSNLLPTISPDAVPANPPALAAPAATRWKSWLILWTVILTLQAILLSNHAALDSLLWRSTRWFTGDQNTYRWAVYEQEHAADVNPPFYARVDPPFTRPQNGVPEARFYKRTEPLWRIFRDLGEPYMTVLIAVIVWIYMQPRVKSVLLLIAATCSTGVLSWLIRATAGRYRPINIDGVNQWHAFRGFWETRDLSWPSGHATLAFATAAALTYLSPRGKWLFLFIAAGCALARVVMQAHFYSDIILGSALGWTFGWLTMQFLDRRMKPAMP